MHHSCSDNTFKDQYSRIQNKLGTSVTISKTDDQVFYYFVEQPTTV